MLRLREYAPPFEDEGGDPDNERFRFFEAVTATLNELALGGPILLVIDDLHAADQPTLLLLRHVLRGTDDGTLGIVGMFIDTEVPPDAPATRRCWRTSAPCIPWRPCTSRACAARPSRSWCRGGRRAADLVPQLCRLTDGNPLFLDELLRQVGYREAERREEGQRGPARPEHRQRPSGNSWRGRSAAARGRDLPAAGGGGGRPRM